MRIGKVDVANNKQHDSKTSSPSSFLRHTSPHSADHLMQAVTFSCCATQPYRYPRDYMC